MTTWDCHAIAATLPYIGLCTMIGDAILHILGSYPGSVLLDLVRSSNYIEFLQVHYYLSPTRLADEERLRSAVRDLIHTIRAKAGDARREAWPFSHDHSPQKDCTFPFWYFISHTRERLAKIAQMVKFNETGNKVYKRCTT